MSTDAATEQMARNLKSVTAARRAIMPVGATASSGAVVNATGQGTWLRDGVFCNLAVGRLERVADAKLQTTNWTPWVVHLDAAPDGRAFPPLPVLPNEIAAGLDKLRPDDVTRPYRFAGMVLVYRGRPYILLSAPPIEPAPPPALPEGAPAATSGEAGGGESGVTAPSGPPTGASAVDRLIGELDAAAGGRPSVVPEPEASIRPTTQEAAKETGTDGAPALTFLASRRGRLLFAADAGGAITGVPSTRRVLRCDNGPIGRAAGDSSGWESQLFILPCAALEQMENSGSRFGESATFVVSGRVVTYRGAGYLLPTVQRLDRIATDLVPIQ